jgi:hypothetical protein
MTKRGARKIHGRTDVKRDSGSLETKLPADGSGRSAMDESYTQVSRGEYHRVGVVSERPQAGRPALLIEFLFRLFEPGRKLEPGDMEKAMAIARALMERGYSVCFQDDGWISCERPVDGERVRYETEYLARLVKGL